MQAGLPARPPTPSGKPRTSACRRRARFRPSLASTPIPPPIASRRIANRPSAERIGRRPVLPENRGQRLVQGAVLCCRGFSASPPGLNRRRPRRSIAGRPRTESARIRRPDRRAGFPPIFRTRRNWPTPSSRQPLGRVRWRRATPASTARWMRAPSPPSRHRRRVRPTHSPAQQQPPRCRRPTGQRLAQAPFCRAGPVLSSTSGPAATSPWQTPTWTPDFGAAPVGRSHGRQRRPWRERSSQRVRSRTWHRDRTGVRVGV